jgi:hypothetical protein
MEMGEPTRFRVVSGRSALIVEARSSVGPISFGTTAIEGWVETEFDETIGEIVGSPSAQLSIHLDTLRSGNKVYDAELLHRVDARRHPATAVVLRDASRLGLSDRYDVTGELTFHGISRSITGTVALSTPGGGRLLVRGEHVFDMRDFDIVAPSVLMLRIYPDVRVQLQLEVERERLDSSALDHDRLGG